MKRRHFFPATAAMYLSATTLQAQPASARNFPEKPIRLLVPFSAGSGTDQLARAIAQAITAEIKVPVLVENRAGAAGMLAVQSVATSPNDGYTLLIGGTTTHAANEFLYKKLPYDPVKDFSPITTLGQGWQVLIVNKDLPVKTVAELIEYAGKNPGKLNFASGSSGSRVGSEAFLQKANLKMTHIPYKGNPLAIADLMAGQTQMMVVDTGTAIPFINDARVRALAVTNAQRSPLLPDVPPIADTFPGYNVTHWFGVWGPANLPADIKQRLNELFARAAKSASADAAFYKPSGTASSTSSPEEMARFQASEAKKYGEIIRGAGIQPE
ncbi:Bug family tripartite tricarboxylate transporter substrate binding protein [Ottowia thiooxydans]|uniref:Bug family tripartite tricarboxylate transporter substrate binding protein n=1 Tax=Ottowia thiooxydans TaxID=219182 RepID=UPI0004115447|nr:tripartite tricarboxylate transporter substrate binding protein [Ottowia thiooxydans]